MKKVEQWLKELGDTPDELVLKMLLCTYQGALISGRLDNLANALAAHNMNEIAWVKGQIIPKDDILSSDIITE